MKIKNTTITFGVSSHYFKTSVSLTFEGSSEDDFEKALSLAKKQYYKALSQELRLSKKFDNMSLEEIENFIGKKL